jgi:hypothetical protein
VYGGAAASLINSKQNGNHTQTKLRLTFMGSMLASISQWLAPCLWVVASLM